MKKLLYLPLFVAAMAFAACESHSADLEPDGVASPATRAVVIGALEIDGPEQVGINVPTIFSIPIGQSPHPAIRLPGQPVTC